MNKTAKRVLVVAGAIVVVAAACDGITSNNDNPKDKPAAAPTHAASATPETNDGCLTVKHGVVKAIVKGFDKSWAKPTGDAAAFKASNGYMVALKVHTPSGDDKAVWLTDSLKPNKQTLVWSVDSMAALYSQWPQGTVQNPMDISVDGAQDALDCL